MITAFYAAVLGFWLVYLYIGVVRYRREYHVGLGDGDKEDLLKAIRIHGNFVETVPYILILMMMLEMLDHRPWIIHLAGILLIVSRLLHFLGLRKSAGASRERYAAGILTLSLIAGGAALLLFRSVSSGAVFALQ